MKKRGKIQFILIIIMILFNTCFFTSFDSMAMKNPNTQKYTPSDFENIQSSHYYSQHVNVEDEVNRINYTNERNQSIIINNTYGTHNEKPFREEKYEKYNSKYFNVSENEFIIKLNFDSSFFNEHEPKELFNHNKSLFNLCVTHNVTIDASHHNRYTYKNSNEKIYRFYKGKVTNGANIFDVINDFNKHPDVEFAEPNFIYKNCVIPDDPYFNQQWGLNQSNDCDINAPEAWDIQQGSSDIVIAIIDTGIDYTHEDLEENIWVNPNEIANNDIDDDQNGFIDDVHGWDFINNDSDPFDDHFHGTHCAGIAGAVSDNTKGIAGVAWHCSLMPVKGLNSGGSGTVYDLSKAIYYAVDNGADIISMSWGGTISSSLIQDAVEYASDHGVFLVAAAGNDGSDSKNHFPSSYEQVIAVAAMDHDNTLASFSNHGFWTDLAAPGVDILSTVPNNEYERYSGTSMACPFVAGIAGLLLSKNQSLSTELIRSMIISGIKKMNTTTYAGQGSVDAYDIITRQPAIARIDPFSDWTNGKGTLAIFGKAWGQDFHHYSLSYCNLTDFVSDNWTTIEYSTNSSNELIGTWNTDLVPDRCYIIKLQVIAHNKSFVSIALIVVNNEYNIFIVDANGEDHYDFRLISEAIMSAGLDDKVCIKSGEYGSYYDEELYIDRSITIQGEDPESVHIYSTMIILADNVSISHLSLEGMSYSILILNVNNSEIYDNIINEDIEFYQSNHNTFHNNQCNASLYGIVLDNSHENSIEANMINSYYFGAYLFFSNGNSFINNTIHSPAGFRFLDSKSNVLSCNRFYDGGLWVRGSNPSFYCNYVSNDNIVNDKPIYYLINVSDFKIPKNCGEVILVHCNNITITSLDITDQYAAIQLVNCSHCIVSRNTIENIRYGIIVSFCNESNSIESNFLRNCIFSVCSLNSQHCLFKYNTLLNNSYGFIQDNSTNDLIANYCSANKYAMYFMFSNHSVIKNNYFIENRHGILFIQSSYNLLRSNHFHSCGVEYEISDKLSDFLNDIDGSNLVNNKPIIVMINEEFITIPSDGGQIILINCSFCTGFNLFNQSENGGHISIIHSDNIEIHNSSFHNSILSNSENCYIEKNVCYQLNLYNCTNCYISDNIIDEDSAEYGIELMSSDYININNNLISNGYSSGNNYIGLIIYDCSHVHIQNNSFLNITGYREDLGGNWTHYAPGYGIYTSRYSICTNCTVMNNSFITSEYSQMISIQGSNNTIGKNVFSDHKDTFYSGVVELKGNDNSFLNNLFKNNYKSMGIELYGSFNHLAKNSFYLNKNVTSIYLYGSKNTVMDNTVDSCYQGIEIYDGSENVIERNTIKNSTFYGIKLHYSDDNIVKKNNISENDIGIYSYKSDQNDFYLNTIKQNLQGIKMFISDENTLFHNYFLENDKNALDQKSYGSITPNNSWDNGYPSGGNYWSDYLGRDENNDGIGDTAYDIIGGLSYDRYPLGYFDETPPNMIIHSPTKHSFYINNQQIASSVLFFKTLIIGDIAISLNAWDDETGLDRVELYINNDLQYIWSSDTSEVYTWSKNTIVQLRHSYKIECIAFDRAGNTKSEIIQVIKLF